MRQIQFLPQITVQCPCRDEAQIWKNIYVTADYQYVTDPIYNAARGPVSILGMRLHWDF